MQGADIFTLEGKVGDWCSERRVTRNSGIVADDYDA